MSDEDCGYCIRCDEAKRSKLTGAARIMRRFPMCPDCGNKRCPKSTWHGNACSGSNEPGQPGSDYGLPDDEPLVRAVELLVDSGMPEVDALRLLGLDDHGSRDVTPEDRRRAVARDLLAHPSPLTITDGMRKALRPGLWAPRDTRTGRFLRSRFRPGSFRRVRHER